MRWPKEQKLKVEAAASLGRGDWVQLVRGAVMVDSADEIRVYKADDVYLDICLDRHVTPGLTLARAQAAGRLLLAERREEWWGEWMVAEPAPGGTLVHVVDVDVREEVARNATHPLGE